MTQPTFKLTNTLTREKQSFVPIDPAHVGMYVCGVTPYDDSHIGHARAYVVFDVLYRLLKHLYPKVTYVRNFTDIDDKIIERAREVGEEPTALAERFIQSYYADMDALNILRPDIEPRVSTSMPEIVLMIDDLISKGVTYPTKSGDVMFDVVAFEKSKGHKPFGYLARRVFDKLQPRVEDDEEKRDPRDFPIWKSNAKSSTKLEQAFYPKELGAKNFTAPGRPGWHIECSVMSKQHLGPTFDIHGGGEDLQFPHHCCEIAQSEALLPAHQSMANFWLHNGFITVGGTKMSKSLGNFTTIKSALHYEDGEPKYSGSAIRLWLLQTHYRKPVDYSDEALLAAQHRHVSYMFAPLVEGAEENNKDEPIPQEFFEALMDDLNTAKALSIIDLNKNPYVQNKMLEFLGIETYSEIPLVLTDEQELILQQRQEARVTKNYSESDRLRDILKTEHGILVEDGPTGQTWRRL